MYIEENILDFNVNKINNRKYLSRHLACSNLSLFWDLVVIQKVSFLKCSIFIVPKH